MTIGIDPKVDYAFKWLFGNEKNSVSLIHLLHAVLNPSPGEQIAELQILNPINEKLGEEEKLSILDIKARDQLGRQFNVEMQMLVSPALRQRILYYWGKLYTEQLRERQSYDLLRPTISICFVDGIVFPAVTEHHLSFRLMDTAHNVALTDHLCIHFIELPKFKRNLDELATPLESWLYFLKHGEDLNPETRLGPLDIPEIRHAMEALIMLSRTDLEKEIYEGRLKALRDQQMYLKDAREEGIAQGLQQGLEQGLERGLEQGLERGLEQGLERGRLEGRTEGMAEGILIGRIEFAQKLLKRDTPTRAELEAMTHEALKEIAAKLEQELTAP